MNPACGCTSQLPVLGGLRSKEQSFVLAHSFQEQLAPLCEEKLQVGQCEGEKLLTCVSQEPEPGGDQDRIVPFSE